MEPSFRLERGADRTIGLVRKRFWILIGAGLAAVGLLIVSAGWWLGWSGRTGPRAVGDRAERISVAIPRGWSDQTGRDARQIVPGDSGDGWVRAPDIVVWKDPPKDGERVPAVVQVFIDIAPEGANLQRLHDISKGSVSGFKQDAKAAGSPVKQWPSLGSTNGKSGESKIITVLSDHFVVSVYTYADVTIDLNEAEQVIATLSIDDRW